jgi:hypothetical protein
VAANRHGICLGLIQSSSDELSSTGVRRRFSFHADATRVRQMPRVDTRIVPVVGGAMARRERCAGQRVGKPAAAKDASWRVAPDGGQ